jgi:hypothetical protein
MLPAAASNLKRQEEGEAGEEASAFGQAVAAWRAIRRQEARKKFANEEFINEESKHKH